MIRKRLLSACLALALCLGLLPVTALAVEGAPNSLYVGDQQVIKGDNPTFWTTDESTGGLTEYKGNDDNWNVKYDPNTATLTLNGATINGALDATSPPYGSGIYALCSSKQPVALTIELIGTNTITGDYGIYVDAQQGGTVGTNASLLIRNSSDNGILEVSGSSHGIYVKSGTGNASLTIKDASVVASSSSSYDDYADVCVHSGIDATSSPKLSLAVDGGSLTTSASEGNDGIQFYVGSPQASNATTSLTVSDNAIVDARNGGISALKILETLPTPTPTGDNRSGIVFDGSTGTVYGTVELQNDLTIGAGETLTIPEGSTLNTNNNLTNNGTIVNTGGTLNGEPDGTGKIETTPTIDTQPASQTVTKGNTATFTVAATGENLSYQWQQSINSGSNWTDISGANAATYTTAATTTSMSGYQYRCVVSNSAGSVTSEVATLTVNEPAPTTYTITADVTPSGAGTATADKTTATAGDTVKLIATANSGYRFTGWTFSDNITDADSSSANTTFTMPAGDVTVTANFEQYYTITVNASAGGTATADKTTAVAGEAVTLTATPDSGYHFTGWTSSDGVTFANASSESTTFTMPAGDVTVTAGFTRISSGSTTYAITAPDAENGTVRVSPSRASRGTTVTITVTPDEGYELESLTVLDSRDNEITLTDKGDGKYTFTMPSGKVTVEASFAEIAPEPLPFGDVDDGDWFAGAVRFVYESGMMNGVSETDFAPHAATSRSMIVTILYRLEGEPVVDYAMDFTDVAGDAYYAEAVRWAASEGIVGGYGGRLFGSDDAVTREQLAAILYRYAVYKGYDVSIGEDTNILSYADFADLSEYAIPAMQWACGAGIVNGTSESTLTPQGEATRAQVAAMLMRFVEAIG